MAEQTVFDRVGEFIAGLPNKLAMAYAANVIRTVDKYAQIFKDSVETQTPFATGALKNSIQLTRHFRNGRYGYRVEFHGYNEWGNPFQAIANALNKGEWVRDDGTHFSSIKHIGFISRNLAILREINPALAENMVIGGWTVDDEKIELNDGTSFTFGELENYQQLLENIRE